MGHGKAELEIHPSYNAVPNLFTIRTTPQVAILVILYFWGDFQIHAVDIYLRYVTAEIEQWVERDENAAEEEWRAIADKIFKFEQDARSMLRAKHNKLEEQIARKVRALQGNISTARNPTTAETDTNYILEHFTARERELYQ